MFADIKHFFAELAGGQKSQATFAETDYRRAAAAALAPVAHLAGDLHQRRQGAPGQELVLVARREQALDRIADGIAATGKPRPTVLALDIALPGTAERIKTELAGHGLAVQYVVNNAGFGLLGLADRLDRAEQLAMIDLNVRALADLSLAFVDRLAPLPGGRLNVASVAGFLPGPGMAVYYATKHFVVSFSESLHY